MILNDLTVDNAFSREFIRKKITDVIDFVNARFKIIYDDKHKFFAFNSKDKIYLRFHREYILLKKSNHKLFNQRSNSYIIKRKVENAVYELIFSQNARIHFVIFITQLKSTKDDSNFFDRFRSINSKFVEMKENTSTKKSYEFERILKEKIRKYEKSL